MATPTFDEDPFRVPRLLEALCRQDLKKFAQLLVSNPASCAIAAHLECKNLLGCGTYGCVHATANPGVVVKIWKIRDPPYNITYPDPPTTEREAFDRQIQERSRTFYLGSLSEVAVGFLLSLYIATKQIPPFFMCPTDVAYCNQPPPMPTPCADAIAAKPRDKELITPTHKRGRRVPKTVLEILQKPGGALGYMLMPRGTELNKVPQEALNGVVMQLFCGLEAARRVANFIHYDTSVKNTLAIQVNPNASWRGKKYGACKFMLLRFDTLYILMPFEGWLVAINDFGTSGICAPGVNIAPKFNPIESWQIFKNYSGETTNTLRPEVKLEHMTVPYYDLVHWLVSFSYNSELANKLHWLKSKVRNNDPGVDSFINNFPLAHSERNGTHGYTGGAPPEKEVYRWFISLFKSLPFLKGGVWTGKTQVVEKVLAKPEVLDFTYEDPTCRLTINELYQQK
jgi:hypothetical protein